MNSIKILFLGAGNRVSLIEQFYRAAAERQLDIVVYSVEDREHVPIAKLARVVVAPRFKDPGFRDWLKRFVSDNHISIIIPNMDAATVALSEFKAELEDIGAFVVVSTAELCRVMEDKFLADGWFRSVGVPVPASDKYPKLFKQRTGFGGKDQVLVKNYNEEVTFRELNNPSSYIIQNFIVGTEYSVDAYVDRQGNLVGRIPRKRLKVIDGEVNESLTVTHPEIEKWTDHILKADAGWRGPITLQFIDSPDAGCRMIEINPRFGGGVTHSIHCGLDGPGMILDEFLGKCITPVTGWKVNSLMTRCRRDVFHDYIG